MIGALSFGHLPIIFAPAGPMTSGIPNKQKAMVREQFAAGQVGRDALLDSEAASYHAAGTCTFYGTANSNQMLMELMACTCRAQPSSIRARRSAKPSLATPPGR